jgi:hypothetical protein
MHVLGAKGGYEVLHGECRAIDISVHSLFVVKNVELEQ